jgi:hypothetical protein
MTELAGELVAGAGRWLGWLVGAGTDEDLPAFDEQALAPYNGATKPELYIALEGACVQACLLCSYS